MFETASRMKFRFVTPKGNLTTEDLWDLTLPQLDELAIGYYKKLDNVVSFTSTQPDTVIKLKFELVKRIIEVKMSDATQKEQAAIKKQNKERILEIIRDKEEETLRGKSLEELKGLLGDI